MTTLVVIPARWNSSRFPGKPLARIAGRLLIERVIDLARRIVYSRPDTMIVVATDDHRVAAAADGFGCRAVMTAPDLANGTLRARAAALAEPVAPRFVLNLQGDAPFVPAAAGDRVLAALAAGNGVATPVVALDWAALDQLQEHKRQAPFSGTTCVRSPEGRALWFSKQIIPAIRDEAAERRRRPMSPVYRHVGLYGYAMEALDRFAATPPTEPERLEGLEQLRFFAGGMPIQTVEIDAPAISMGGIDTPQDVVLAEQLVAAHGDPFGG